MPPPRFDPEQRFTCSGCARCCHAEVVVTPVEHAAYVRARAERWFRESAAAAPGAASEPFVALESKPGWFRIRRRPDGVCGFLSAENRCRLHEELGGDRKPLVCRLFPFSLYRPDPQAPVAVTSFCCPTVVGNEGLPLTQQTVALVSLQRAWSKEYGDDVKPLRLVSGRPLSPAGAEAVRQTLLSLLGPRPAAGADLAARVRRMGRWLEDLTRPRVVRLPPDDFAEYARLTGRHAAEDPAPVRPRKPSALARLFARGFLFVAGVVETTRHRPHETGLRLGLRWRFVRLLAHAHGLGPALPELDVRARRRIRFDAQDAGAAEIAHHYLRASIETADSGRRPVLEEIAFAAAVLNAGMALGAMAAQQGQRPSVDAAALREGLVGASYLTHVDSPGLASALVMLSGGIAAFDLLATALEPPVLRA